MSGQAMPPGYEPGLEYGEGVYPAEVADRRESTADRPTRSSTRDYGPNVSEALFF